MCRIGVVYFLTTSSVVSVQEYMELEVVVRQIGFEIYLLWSSWFIVCVWMACRLLGVGLYCVDVVAVAGPICGVSL